MWMEETGEEQEEELKVLRAGLLGGRAQCQLALNLYLSSTYGEIPAGDGRLLVEDGKASVVSGQGYWRPIRSAWGCSRQQS